ncbi:MAG: M28 family peptidase, partial [Nitrospinota bacterium]
MAPVNPVAGGEAREFDAEAAYELVKKQVALGSRALGRPGHRAARSLLLAELRRRADRVWEQEFRWRGFTLTNLVAEVRGDYSGKPRPRLLFATHWDTHPFAVREEEPFLRRRPVPGANDGASGVAVLLEVARALRARRPPRDVLIVLFDGEDWGQDGQWFIGSTHFARTALAPGGPFPAGSFRYGLVVDMVGDRDLQIHPEGHSQRDAPDVVRRVWESARRVGARGFLPGVRHWVRDDHLPLNAAGLRTALLIDFDYPAWHTT